MNIKYIALCSLLLFSNVSCATEENNKGSRHAIKTVYVIGTIAVILSGIESGTNDPLMKTTISPLGSHNPPLTHKTIERGYYQIVKKGKELPDKQCATREMCLRATSVQDNNCIWKKVRRCVKGYTPGYVINFLEYVSGEKLEREMNEIIEYYESD